jgi:EAL domain-containing protein (putative c-di-GMP-specific phosphodiesterase class I)
LRLYLQPKVPLQGSGTIAAEALVRWQHPQRGLVPPMQFIPFAEQTGFVRQLTLWIFDAVARLLATHPVQARGLRVSVNLSTRDLLDPELSNRLGTILARHSVDARAFCLEITESAIMDDPQRAEAMLNRLSEQGFKLSIDDFGTGYSSLAYLKRLPVDELKIDKSFVMGMATGEDDAMIVRSTIDLAHNLGLTVVAEGVETAAIFEQLRQLSCDEAQGYHIARPLPVEEFLLWQAGARPVG